MPITIMQKKDILAAVKVIEDFSRTLRELLEQVPEEHLKGELEEYKATTGWRPTIKGCD
jgi:hypothetical protein